MIVYERQPLPTKVFIDRPDVRTPSQGMNDFALHTSKPVLRHLHLRSDRSKARYSNMLLGVFVTAINLPSNKYCACKTIFCLIVLLIKHPKRMTLAQLSLRIGRLNCLRRLNSCLSKVYTFADIEERHCRTKSNTSADGHRTS